MDTVRVLRVIEYEGPRDWVEDCLQKRGIKGEYRLNKYEVYGRVIREAIIGEVPTILESPSKPKRKEVI